MRHYSIFFTTTLLLMAAIGCNPANQKKAPEPPVTHGDTIILKPQHGYYDRVSGSYVNMFNVMQVSHSTSTDSAFYMVKLDSVLDATNYHLNMQLANVKQVNGQFDVHVGCNLNLTPRTDTTADSSCMFIAQYNNGNTMTFDTVRVHKQDKDFTLHIKNATGAFYYIVLWNLYPVANSTISYGDIMVTKPNS